MLIIRDLTGNEEALTDFQDLTRKRKVNGEKTLSLTVIPTKSNQHSFSMVEEESVITLDNEEYVIKQLTERSIGNTIIKRVEAIHRFFVDLINKQQPNIHNGSMTFAAFLDFVFNGTGYSYLIIDSFYAKAFENLGNDNRLSLLKKGLERYQAEMEIIGKTVRFKKKIGADTDFQFRYGHNVKTIEKTVDTTDLSTVISGTGAEGITAYYRSPNADIFGELDAPPVNDERFKSQETLLDEMKARLRDTPEISITIDFQELKQAQYNNSVPSEGDRGFVIYEPMNDLFIETRIMEIEEVLDHELKPRKTNVTLANYQKTFSGTLLNAVQKSLKNIVNDDGIIKYNVLDEAVRIATEALQSAQTELEFENGIIAREKSNLNRLVLLNSAGLGISKDGGGTFTEAITADGFVLSAGAIGQLSANNIQIGAATTFEDGYNPAEVETSLRGDLNLTAPLPTSITMNANGIQATTSDSSKYARLDYRGLYIKGGAIQIDGGLPDSQIAGASTWNKQGTYIDSSGVYTGKVEAEQIAGGIITGALLQTATSGKRIKVQKEDYAALDGSVQKISLGFRALSEGNTDAPRFAMGIDGVNPDGASSDGSYFVMTHYPANNNPQGNYGYAYVDLAYRINSGTMADDYSNIKMYDDGVIRIAAVRDLEITTNWLNGEYAGTDERKLARFGTSISQFYNSNLEIGCVRNTDNGTGLILADINVPSGAPQTLVRVQTDSYGDQYFRPVTTSGSIQLGSGSYPWEAVFAVNGQVQSSALYRKSDVKQVKPFDPAIGNMTPLSITSDDAIEFIQNLNTYTYVYKKSEEYVDENGEIQFRLIDRTIEEALEEGDFTSIQLGLLADENLDNPMAHFFLTGRDEKTWGVQVMSVLTAAIITIQKQNERIKVLEEALPV